MSITVSGLGSGLDYESWIESLVQLKQDKIDAVSTKVTETESKKSALSALKSKYTTLLDAVTAFTDALSTNDVFNQKTSSSTSDAVSASVTSNVNAQNISVSVSKLATSTVAKSGTVAASYVDETTTISSIAEGAIKEGTFSVYVDGKKNTINITSGQTLEQVRASLDEIDGISADISDDGKLIIESESEEQKISVGSSSDTSNFSNVMSLTKNSDHKYSSSKSIFDTDTSAALTSASASFAGGPVTAGTFMIGNTTFTIDSSTTLDSIITKINKSDAGVTAAWDANAGKLVLTANEEGAFNINITPGDGTAGYENASNFTDIMGLTTSEIVDGRLESTKLNELSQTLGSNAVLTINGTEITSSSNTVTSDISGINGLTLTLNSTTTETAEVSITQDTQKITDAITNLVNAYNAAITSTDSATSTDGTLHGETLLNSLKNKVRSLITSAVTGEDGYKSLANIGITTGAYSTNTDADTSKLQIDTDKLAAALTDNIDAVKTMLVGNKTTGTKGILTDIETVIENSTDAVKGYFTTRDKAYDQQIDRFEDKIDSMTVSLEKYRERLDAKFQAMDELISNLQNQASVFDSYFGDSSSDDDE